MQPESLLSTGFSGCDYLIFCKIGRLRIYAQYLQPENQIVLIND
ncbi:hypothetical protein QEO94_05615 [Kingella negevensis]|nr:hypothetical protein [Kingella negevensis]WII94253.1 hypothetical protein QEO94_05615 [Kingella negevensis]